ncbi:MAG: energy transducer TonB [Pseudomonadales bacterium]|nr:energy transducer TonB [Pseudomonadales bacterium]
MLAWYDETAANDRLFFALVVALLVHAGLILGVGFAPEEHAPAPRSLEITLAQLQEDIADPDADFLAQSNQHGSGTLSTAASLSTPVAAERDAAIVQEVLRQTSAPPPAQVTPSTLLNTTSDAPTSTPILSTEQSASPVGAPDQTPDNARSAAEIASLMARLDTQQRAYAKLPRVYRLTSVSTRAALDATYLLNWTQRIETIGNNNYPLEARTRRLYGDLRLLVAVAPDGSVKEVRVLQSSGYRLLDDAAIRIVRLAEPFDAFPPELRAEADVLEIIRTWQFRSNRLSARE